MKAQRGNTSEPKTSLGGWMTQQTNRISSGIIVKFSWIDRYYTLSKTH